MALIALALWPGPPVLLASLALAVCLSLIRALRRPWPVQLTLTRAGIWELIRSDGQMFRGNIADGRVVPAVISITFSGRSAGPVLLLADTFGERDHKRLRGMLRHRCGGAS